MTENNTNQNVSPSDNTLILRLVLVLLALLASYALLLYLNMNVTAELSRIILSYISVLIWPIAITLLVLRFRSNIANFLDNSQLKGIGPGGMSVDSAAPANQDIKASPDPEKVENFEKIANEEAGKDVVKGEEDQELINRLNLELEFERIYNIIFQSQINLLRKLRAGNMTWDQLSGYFYLEQRKNVLAYKNWNASQYIDFLVRSDLIAAVDQAGNIELTQRGDVFLSYVDYMGYQKFGI